MARHFLQLYLLIVLTLAAVSWGQDKLWEIYSRQGDTPESQSATLAVVGEQLRAIAPAERQQFVAKLAAKTGVDLELFDMQDIAGGDTLERLTRGEIAYMRAARQEWLLKRLADDGRVLAFRYTGPVDARGPLDWTLAFVFYAAIALVIMAWLWPLTRDLRQLERSTTTFGDRNWSFDARIGARSQIYPLAEAFRRMAARIDSLVSSQKDLSNAMSHEIKTPLARMRFEIEMARTATGADTLARHLSNIDVDIAELDSFVRATLDYAILERAEVVLNVAEHDLTVMLPAVVESIRRNAREDLEIRCETAADATRVRCDAHLMETVLRNLLYNAIRYARSVIHVSFRIRPGGSYELSVDDDGPGIPEADRTRVFDSFVQLDDPDRRRSGYGLGLAIVKRILEWHGGQVAVGRSSLGGASFVLTWDARQGHRSHSQNPRAS
jgi:two-component system OmpR family sensor kinase